MLGSPKFPPPEEGGETHQKSAPEDKKKKAPHLTKRGSSNVLAQGSFIRVLTVLEQIYRKNGPRHYAAVGQRTQYIKVGGTRIRSQQCTHIPATHVPRIIATNTTPLPCLPFWLFGEVDCFGSEE